MTRRYAVTATGATRESRPHKPYLWRGKRDLADMNDRMAAERAEAERAGAKRVPVQFFSWPLPLPGQTREQWKPAQAPDGERTQVA